MVAPLAVLGIVAGLGTVLSALVSPKKRFWVLWVHGSARDMIGRKFDDRDKAEAFQQVLANKGRSSAIVIREGQKWDLQHPVTRVVHRGRGKKPITLAPTVPEMKGRHDNFDTVEEMVRENEALNPQLPTARWAKQARSGPYPRRDLVPTGSMKVTPLFDDTSSSHMWKSDAPTFQLPARFQTPDRFGGEDAAIL